MALFGYCRKQECTAVAVIAAAIIGIVTAFLRYAAVITVTPAFMWVVFGIAVVYLAATLIAVALAGGLPTCCWTSFALSTVLSGIVGTILFSVILLAISVVATSVIGAIVTGLLLFFFALIIGATVCLVKCLANDTP